MAYWVGAKGQVHLAKMAKTCPHCDVTHSEPQTQNKIKYKLEDLRTPQKV